MFDYYLSTRSVKLSNLISQLLFFGAVKLCRLRISKIPIRATSAEDKLFDPIGKINGVTIRFGAYRKNIGSLLFN